MLAVNSGQVVAHLQTLGCGLLTASPFLHCLDEIGHTGRGWLFLQTPVMISLEQIFQNIDFILKCDLFW